MSIDEDVEKFENSHITDGNVKWCDCCLGMRSCTSSKVKNMELPYEAAVLLLDITPKVPGKHTVGVQ